MKITKLKTTGLLCFVLFSIYFDLMFSYLAYNDNPRYFINSEASTEIVSFFTKGNIPILSIFSIIGMIITCLVIIPILSKKENRLSIIFFNAILIGGVVRICGGLSWYNEMFSFIIYLLEIIISIYVAYHVLTYLKKPKGLNDIKT